MYMWHKCMFFAFMFLGSIALALGEWGWVAFDALFALINFIDMKKEQR